MSPETIYHPTQSLLAREVDDGVVLISPAEGEIKVLNPVGGLIWEMVTQKKSIAEIESNLSQQFQEISRDQIERDLRHFIAELLQRELIRPL